ncbi:MAG TPA: DUF1848 domain-containing protein [Synergistaceae bacterium]|nr:DUF1848 domain-containing protein [Synergistaceae bacterium]
MIISASRRTDIPAFYAPWLMNRIRQGYCMVPNPYNAKQISRISLAPEDVDALVFWTRNPAPLLPFLEEIRNRGLEPFFLVTLTGYPEEYEPYMPQRALLLDNIKRLAESIGPSRIAWRYDPIILSDETSPSWHLENFSFLASSLRSSICRCILSLLDLYPSLERRFRSLPPAFQPWKEERFSRGMEELFPALRETVDTLKLPLQSCAETRDLTSWGIYPGACIDPIWISRNGAKALKIGKDPHQRPFCLCASSRDIGMYRSCRYGCRYCYASPLSPAREPKPPHFPESPSLLGKV